MVRLNRSHVELGTLALTFVTGIVDAVGYLGLDRVFTGNMTGNIVILGMGVAGADELPVLGPAIALPGFTHIAVPLGLATGLTCLVVIVGHIGLREQSTALDAAETDVRRRTVLGLW